MFNYNYKSNKYYVNFGPDIYYEEIVELIKTNKNYLDAICKYTKRGDLIINSAVEDYRNYNVYIIDFIKNDEIIIKYLDEDNGDEGYPKVPIDFLDILLINNKFWFDNLNMNDDYDLDQYSIELSNLTDNDFISTFNLEINNILNNNIILIFKKYNIPLNLYKLLYLYIENPILPKWFIKNTKCFVNTKDLTKLIEFIDYKNTNYNLISYKIINNFYYIYL